VLGIDGSIQTIVLGVIIVLIMAYTTNKAKMALGGYFGTPPSLLHAITILCKIITDIYIPQGQSKN